MNQSKTTTHSINPKPIDTSFQSQYSEHKKIINTASNTDHTQRIDSFLVGFLKWKLSLFPYSPNLSFCAEPRRSRRIHHPTENPRPPRGGTVQTVGEGRERALFRHPHPPWRVPSPRRRFSFAYENSRFCNSGRPSVQNDRRVRGEHWKRGCCNSGRTLITGKHGWTKKPSLDWRKTKHENLSKKVWFGNSPNMKLESSFWS